MAVFNGGVQMRRAKPAAFAPNPARRAMLAKAHIAKSQLGLSDDDYRAVLLRVTTRTSAADCTDAELQALLDEFAAKGFSAKPRRAGAKPADHPVARKARAMWISLHHLAPETVADPSEAALEAFARRQLKCAKLQWANQSQSDALIEALKAMAERHRWDQSLAGMRADDRVKVLKARLLDAIRRRLVAVGLVPDDWPIERVAFELAGYRIERMSLATTTEVDVLARVLGAKLRAALA